jgi:hypothetical protein
VVGVIVKADAFGLETTQDGTKLAETTAERDNP